MENKIINIYHRAECLDIINYSYPLKRGNLNVSVAH